jgi:site-specific recombinase XerD
MTSTTDNGHLCDDETAGRADAHLSGRTPPVRLQRVHRGHTEAELVHLLAQIDRTTIDGERDYVLIALLYDTGARIQELLDLTPSDVRFVPPALARLHGKGRRERLCPLLPQTARIVSRYLARVSRPLDDRAPWFRNRYEQPLKRHGARYLLIKYLDRARASMPSLRRSGISPHTVRHNTETAITVSCPRTVKFPFSHAPQSSGLSATHPTADDARSSDQ